MANNKLINKDFILPKEVLSHLQKTLGNYNGDKTVQGYKRLNNIVNGDGELTYYNLKRIKNFFDNYKPENNNKVEFELNGGDIMKSWVDKTLDSSRTQVDQIEKSKTNKTDLGLISGNRDTSGFGTNHRKGGDKSSLTDTSSVQPNKPVIYGEDINIPVEKGDTILMGKFKNKKVVVKDIDKDEHGMPTINGKKATTFRTLKEDININKQGIDFVFEQHPELTSIGTPEQYSEYINSIFPNSKIKDIVYHTSTNKFSEFKDPSTSGLSHIWFSDKPLNNQYGENTYSVILNIKNPLDEFNNTDYNKEIKNYEVSINPEWRNNYHLTGELPQYKYDGTIRPSKVDNGRSITVRTPNQIHILGSKKDMEGFKRFVGNNHLDETKTTINEEVENQILYHGTRFNNNINTFDLSNVNLGVSNNVWSQGNGGIYLTNNVNAAKYFSRKANEFYFLKKSLTDKENGLSYQDKAWDMLFGDDATKSENVLEVKLNNANIKRLDFYPTANDVEKIKEEGEYDGVSFIEAGLTFAQDIPKDLQGKIGTNSLTYFIFNPEVLSITRKLNENKKIKVKLTEGQLKEFGERMLLNPLILEKLGVPDFMDGLLDKLFNYVKDNVPNNISEYYLDDSGELVFDIDTRNIDVFENTFLSNPKTSITLHLIKDKDVYDNIVDLGGRPQYFTPTNSRLSEDKEKLENGRFIFNFIIYNNDIDYINYGNASHELTHSYDEFNKLLHGRSLNEPYLVNKRIGQSNMAAKKEDIFNKIGHGLYLVDRAEQNAFVAQAYYEFKKFDINRDNYKSSPLYKKIIYLGVLIEKINKLTDSEIEKLRKDLEDYSDEFINVGDTNKLKEKLIYKFSDTKKRLENKFFRVLTLFLNKKQ